MILTEQENSILKDLQTQERVCMEHYNLCASTAKDGCLKDLFTEIAKDEQEHFQSLGRVINGEAPMIKPAPAASRVDSYQPKAVYKDSSNQADKQHDALLCSDSIGNEKMVSADYNTHVFKFGNGEIRKLLNHIQTEEQEHAEMIYKYKKANSMA
ncbi:MAG: ferritin-like domain-containing protein [Lachnospiraceae bacterium]|nr:ferritin-like domain-containing protein [Lachnospiraceae bacterium]